MDGTSDLTFDFMSNIFVIICRYLTRYLGRD